ASVFLTGRPAEAGGLRRPSLGGRKARPLAVAGGRGGYPVRSSGLLLDGLGVAVHGAAADRGAVHHDAAGAARVHHAAHAVTAGLDHLAALGVAAGAGDAAAGLGHVDLAQAHGQVAGADGHAVEHDAAAAHAAGQHGTQVLHHAAGHLVLADAGDLHAAGALLEL